MNRGADIWNSSVRSFPLVRICRTRSGSGNGSPLRNRSLIKLKIVVFSPMPTASVKTATQVNAGDLRSWRSANFMSVMSFILFGSQRGNWVDVCGAACRYQTSQQRGRREQNCCAAEQHWVVRRNLIELRRDQAVERERRNDAEREPAHHRLHSLVHNQAQHVARLRTQRHAHSNFSCALLDGVRHCAVNPDAGEEQGDSSKNSEQPHHQTRLPERSSDDRV